MDCFFLVYDSLSWDKSGILTSELATLMLRWVTCFIQGHSLNCQAGSPDHLISEVVSWLCHKGPPFQNGEAFHSELGFQHCLGNTHPLTALLLQMKWVSSAFTSAVTTVTAEKIFSAGSTWLSSHAHFSLCFSTSLHLHHILPLFNDSLEKRNPMHFKEDLWHLSKSKNWEKVYSYSWAC